MSNRTTEGAICRSPRSYGTPACAFAFLDGLMSNGDDMIEEIGVFVEEQRQYTNAKRDMWCTTRYYWALFYDYGCDEDAGDYDEMPEGVVRR